MFWQDAQLSLLGRLLLLKGIQIFGKPVCPKIEFNDYKKPYFKNCNLQFNISHSNKIVVCALNSNNPIGIDIEHFSSVNFEAFKNQMTVEEWQRINNSKDKLKTFYHYWTKKEAALKAIGAGLSISPKSFEVILNKTIIKGCTYHFKEIRINPEYSCFLSSINKSGIENIKLTRYSITDGLLIET